MIARKRTTWSYAPPRLDLDKSAISPEAKALVSHCLEALILPSLTDSQKRPTSLPALKRGTECLLGGLCALKVAQWARRPMSTARFTKEPVSRNQFMKVLDPLVTAGLIERSGGSYDRVGPVPRGLDTRLRLAIAGWELLELFGLGEGELDHFTIIDPKHTS